MMKFYEQMNPLDRKIMLLKAVNYSVAIEGMKETSEKIIKDITLLEQQKLNATLQATSNQANE